MVSYQTMVKLAFAVAEAKGANFDGIEESGQFISDIAEYWQNNKAELKQLTESQTRKQLQQVVEP